MGSRLEDLLEELVLEIKGLRADFQAAMPVLRHLSETEALYGRQEQLMAHLRGAGLALGTTPAAADERGTHG